MGKTILGQTEYEKGIEILNSILFCHNIEELKQLKPKLDQVISGLKNNFNDEDPSVHKDNMIELMQDLLVTYHDKEQSLLIMKRELSLQRYIKYLTIGLILVIGLVLFLSIKTFLKTEKEKERPIQTPAQISMDLPLIDRIVLLEEKVQELQKEKEKTTILMKNFKKENDQIMKNLDNAKEKLTYLEGLIREIRIEKNFSR